MRVMKDLISEYAQINTNMNSEFLDSTIKRVLSNIALLRPHASILPHVEHTACHLRLSTQHVLTPRLELPKGDVLQLVCSHR